jgi:hypothetical protein
MASTNPLVIAYKKERLGLNDAKSKTHSGSAQKLFFHLTDLFPDSDPTEIENVVNQVNILFLLFGV